MPNLGIRRCLIRELGYSALYSLVTIAARFSDFDIMSVSRLKVLRVLSCARVRL